MSSKIATIAPTGENYRFWTRTLTMQAPQGDRNSLDELRGCLHAALQAESIDISRMQTGLAMIQSLGLIVPIHDGVIQTQHIQPLPAPNLNSEVAPIFTSSISPSIISENTDSSSSNNVIVNLYGFSPRAQHVIVAPSEEERPVNVERLEELNRALFKLQISPDELVSDDLAGTPPARIYRSFVSPR
jgi:hypothetical protein